MCSKVYNWVTQKNVVWPQKRAETKMYLMSKFGVLASRTIAMSKHFFLSEKTLKLKNV